MSRRSLIVTLALLLVLSACGEALEGPMPRVLNLRVDGERVRAVVPVLYQLGDSGGVPLSVDVLVSLDDGPFRSATPAPGSVSGGGVIPDSGFKYLFLWDSLADTGYARRKATVRLLAQNPYGRARMTASSVTVVNDNHAPQVSFGPRRVNEDGSIVLSVGVADPEGDRVNLDLAVRVGDGEAFPATLRDAPRLFDAPVEGKVLELTWEAVADLPAGGSRHVVLSLTASDSLGPGHTRASGPFGVYPEFPLTLSLDATTPTQRGEIPLFYRLSGRLGTLVTLEPSYWLAGSDSPRPLTPAPSFIDSLSNRARPEGAVHRLIWDSSADLEQPIVRALRVLLTVTHVNGKALREPFGVWGEPFDVDNAALSAGPLISEIYPGVMGADGFIELAAMPGTGFDRVRLFRIFKDGSTEEATGRAFLSLHGRSMGESGLMVIAGPLGPPADVVWEDFDTFFPDREPFTLVLHLAESDYYYDAVGMGDFKNATNSAGSQGDGDPAAYPPQGMSLQRRLANTNARQNVLDFVFGDPDPGRADLWPVWP